MRDFRIRILVCFPHLSTIPYHYQFLRVNMEEMSCYIIHLVKYKGCKCYNNSRGGNCLRSFVVFPLASLLFFGFIRLNLLVRRKWVVLLLILCSVSAAKFT